MSEKRRAKRPAFKPVPASWTSEQMNTWWLVLSLLGLLVTWLGAYIQSPEAWYKGPAGAFAIGLLVALAAIRLVMYLLDRRWRRREAAILHNKNAEVAEQADMKRVMQGIASDRGEEIRGLEAELTKVTEQRDELFRQFQVFVHEVRHQSPFITWFGEDGSRLSQFSDCELITDPRLFLERVQEVRDIFEDQYGDAWEAKRMDLEQLEVEFNYLHREACFILSADILAQVIEMNRVKGVPREIRDCQDRLILAVLKAWAELMKVQARLFEQDSDRLARWTFNSGKPWTFGPGGVHTGEAMIFSIGSDDGDFAPEDLHKALHDLRDSKADQFLSVMRRMPRRARKFFQGLATSPRALDPLVQVPDRQIDP